MIGTTLHKADTATSGVGWKLAIFFGGMLVAVGLFYVRDVPTRSEWQRVEGHVRDAEKELAVLKVFVRTTEETMREVKTKLEEMARENRARPQQPR